MTRAADLATDPAEDAATPTEQSDTSGDPTPDPSLTVQNGEPDAGSEATERASDLEAELTTLRARAELAETKRIPALQAKIAEKEKERDRALAEANQSRAGMLEWTRQVLVSTDNTDRWREIEGFEQERTGKTLETQASRAETMEVINDLLDSDDNDSRSFGRYLKSQVRAATEGGVPVKVTPTNLGTYKRMFDEARGVAPTTANAQPTQAVKAVAPVAPTKPTPPRTVAPSGAPQTVGEPAYRKGDSARSLFQRAFARRDGRDDAQA